jgi:hypothetical protein
MGTELFRWVGAGASNAIPMSGSIGVLACAGVGSSTKCILLCSAIDAGCMWTGSPDVLAQAAQAVTILTWFNQVQMQSYCPLHVMYRLCSRNFVSSCSSLPHFSTSRP